MGEPQFQFGSAQPRLAKAIRDKEERPLKGPLGLYGSFMRLYKGFIGVSGSSCPVRLVKALQCTATRFKFRL